MQPGPVFFKTPRKMQLFGVHAEGISRQVNYLIDEASSSGKGANVVVSLLHHFLETYGVGEDHLELHADNCAGQNKNNIMMRCYLMWRVATGLHKFACISFMVAGHTKFAPDWCFGLLKRMTRSFLSSQADIEAACKASSVCNLSQCVGTQDGQVIVPCYDWATFFHDAYKQIVGLLSLHSFAVSAEAPSVMEVRKFSRGAAERLSLGKGPCPAGLPSVVPAKGLSVERQAYLYKEIREFCREGTEDEVCPQPPQMPAPVIVATAPATVATPPTAGPSAPKRGRQSGRGGRSRVRRCRGGRHSPATVVTAPTAGPSSAP